MDGLSRRVQVHVRLRISDRYDIGGQLNREKKPGGEPGA